MYTISRWTTASGATTYLEGRLLGAEGTLAVAAEGVGAAPFVEVEAAILLEGATGQAIPVEAGVLLRVATVVNVRGALESRSIQPSLELWSARWSISRVPDG